MKIKLWGTRGSIPVPGKDTTLFGGNTTCIEITLESEKKIIIDSGTGIRELGKKRFSEEKDVEIILLITHIHWDHLLGFPFFDPIYRPGTKISIDGFPTCMKGLRATFDNKMGDGFFPIIFSDIEAEITYLDTLRKESLEIDGTIIDRISLQHPQGGYGFRFREGNKRFVFITDNELTNDAWAERRPEDFAEFCQDADLLIHDAQYTTEERKIRRGWGHSDFMSAIDLAMNAHAKKLIIFHHDPARKDSELSALRKTCNKITPENKNTLEVDIAQEGTEFEL